MTCFKSFHLGTSTAHPGLQKEEECIRTVKALIISDHSEWMARSWLTVQSFKLQKGLTGCSESFLPFIKISQSKVTAARGMHHEQILYLETERRITYIGIPPRIKYLQVNGFIMQNSHIFYAVSE